MRALPLLCLICAPTLRPARAQVAAKPATSTPIRYSRDVPQSVLRLMPRGAKSLFWGKFSPKRGSGLMAIHLFQLKPRKNEGEQTHYFGLGLFSMAKGNALKSIQQTSFLCTSSWGLQGNIVSAELMWLDRIKHVPIVKFSVLSHGGYGLYGDELTATFAKGWHQTPVVQTWATGAWFSSDTIGEVNYWKRRDQKGLLEVIAIESIPEPDNPQRVTWWRWLGQNFVAVKRQTLSPPINPVKIEGSTQVLRQGKLKCLSLNVKNLR